MRSKWDPPGINSLARVQCQDDEHCPEPARYDARFLCCNASWLVCSGHRAKRRRFSERGEPIPCPGCHTATPSDHTTWRPL